ncbi:hypothetical protein Ahy_A02g007399 [Arachis hypogaea]|uniref:Aminotransferase-like plant mobile domain-containing protein n=1 Tax=Arachis hypogaea TaxID=3818 RepID=A0A445EC42_ARAHY|nr:hypothetical protein Ahy_A02g007399 [Arachis hypogaea]
MSPFRECTIILQDVAYQFELLVDGETVSGCFSQFEQFMPEGRPARVWFQELFDELPPNQYIHKHTIYQKVSEDTLFGYKSGARVYIRWFLYVAKPDELEKYSWGSTTLACLYRCMCRVANQNVVQLASLLTLLWPWIFWHFPIFKLHTYDSFVWPLASRLIVLYLSLVQFGRVQYQLERTLTLIS